MLFAVLTDTTYLLYNTPVSYNKSIYIISNAWQCNKEIEMKKVVIERERTIRYRGISAAARELGVSRNALFNVVTGRVPTALGKELRDRIEIVDLAIDAENIAEDKRLPR